MKQIDKVFEKKLKNQQVDVPNHLWDKIQSGIENEKRRIIPLWIWAAGIVTILALGWWAYHNLNHNTPKGKRPLAATIPIHNTNDIVQAGPSYNRKIEKEKTEVGVQKPVTKSNFTVKSGSRKPFSNSPSKEIKKRVNPKKAVSKPANLIITKTILTGNKSIVNKTTLPLKQLSSANRKVKKMSLLPLPELLLKKKEINI